MADRGLINALTQAILSRIYPNLKNMYSKSSNSAFSSQNQYVNPGVSDNQTGMETNQVNPGVSDHQTGTECRKRAAEESADSEKHLHAINRVVHLLWNHPRRKTRSTRDLLPLTLVGKPAMNGVPF